jgi:hypothetical protein
MRQFSTMLLALPLCTMPLLAHAEEGDLAKPVKRLELRGDTLQGKNDLQLAQIPVPQLLGPYERSRMPWIGLLLEQPDQEETFGRLWNAFGSPERYRANQVLAREAIEPMKLDQLLEVVTSSLPVGKFDQDGAMILARGNGLLCMLDAESLKFLRQGTEMLRQSIAPRARFRYVLFESESAPAVGSAQAAQVQSALSQQVREGRARILYDSSAGVRVGDSVFLGEEERLSYQGDLQVEVAQEAGIGHAVAKTQELGHSLGLVSWQLPGTDEIALFGAWTHRFAEDGIQRVDLQAAKLRSMETLRIRHQQELFSLRIADGQAYVFSPSPKEQPGLRAMLVCEGLGKRPQPLACPDGRVLSTVPVEVLRSLAMRGQEGMDNKLGAPFGMMLPGPILPADLLYDSMMNLSGDDQLDIMPAGAHVLLLGRPSSVAAAQKVASFYARPVQRSFSVVVQREIAPMDEPNGEYRPHGAALRLECMGGRYGFGMRGLEQQILNEYSVEIAQESVMADPQSVGVFDGVMALAAAEPVGDKVHVRVQVLDRALHELRHLPAAADKTGAVQLPIVRETLLKESHDLAPGAQIVLGGGVVRHLDGRPCRTRFTLQLLER